MPVYPPHYQDAHNFIISMSKYNLDKQADIWLVFTNEADKQAFGDFPNCIILSPDLQNSADRCLINIKKFHGLMQLKNDYEYIIVIDAESEIIKNIDLQKMCNQFYYDKKLYGNSILDNSKGIIDASAHFFKENPKLKTINTDLYLWFNQPCIYKTSFLDDFFTITNIKDTLKDVPALAFDYYIYMFYLLLYKDFSIFDLKCTAVWGIIEGTSFVPQDDTYKKVSFYIANPELLPQLDNPNLFLLIQKDKRPLRLAIQLFGHLRTFEETFKHFKQYLLTPNILATYHIDIFIHTWDELDHSTVNYRNMEGKSLIDKKMAQQDIDLAKELYQPKAMQIDHQLDCPEEIITEKIHSFPRSKKGCLNNAYTIYSVNELRKRYEIEKNIQYDWVIMTRPDVLFKKDLNLRYLFESYMKEKLNIPKDGVFHAFNPFGRDNMIEEPQFSTGSDLIYLATPENMNKATSLYSNFEENIDVNNFYCMEVWWCDYWRKLGLTPYPINYRHGPDFDIIKTLSIFPHSKKAKRSKCTKWKIEKIILSLLPNFLVGRRVNKLRNKIKACK